MSWCSFFAFRASLDSDLCQWAPFVASDPGPGVNNAFEDAMPPCKSYTPCSKGRQSYRTENSPACYYYPRVDEEGEIILSSYY